MRSHSCVGIETCASTGEIERSIPSGRRAQSNAPNQRVQVLVPTLCGMITKSTVATPRSPLMEPIDARSIGQRQSGAGKATHQWLGNVRPIMRASDERCFCL